MSESGLEQMDELRQRARRQVPPVRHPRKRPVSSVSEDSAPAPTHIEEPSRTADAVVDPGETTTDSATSQIEGDTSPAGSPERPVRRRQRVRATQVHLDELSEDHLNHIKKRAVLADVDLTNSAVLRLALAELVDRHGYDQIVAMFEYDESRIRRGRPRQ